MVENENEITAAAINKIAGFLAVRDVSVLSREELRARSRVETADLLILLGHELIVSAEAAARAMADGVAAELLIAGGVGHSTQILRDRVSQHPLYQGIDVEEKSEAEIMAEVVVRANANAIPRDRIILETESTNCGSNAAFALQTLRRLGKKPRTIILIQDPTMQRRTLASFQRAWKDAGEEAQFISFAPFVPKVKLQGEEPVFDAMDPSAGSVWAMERFLSLVMGEIPRLTDDEHGYGPRGKNFIDHVDIPTDVRLAYNQLRGHFGRYERKAQKI